MRVLAVWASLGLNALLSLMALAAVLTGSSTYPPPFVALVTLWFAASAVGFLAFLHTETA